jgi:hypothetical protein
MKKKQKGKKYGMTDVHWEKARSMGLTEAAVLSRLSRNGGNIENALSKNRYVRGQEYGMTEDLWEEATAKGLSYNTVMGRLKKDPDLKMALLPKYSKSRKHKENLSACRFVRLSVENDVALLNYCKSENKSISDVIAVAVARFLEGL